VLTFAKLGSIENPPNSGIQGDKLVAGNGLAFASAERKLPRTARR